MQCHIASELMSLRLDALLTAEQERQLEHHLGCCADCQHEWVALLEAMALFEDPEWMAPPTDMTQQVMQRIHRRSLWASALRSLALLLLAGAVLLAIGLVPAATLLGVAVGSPSVFSALVSMIVRTYDVMGALLVAFGNLSKAALFGNGSLLIGAGALFCVAIERAMDACCGPATSAGG